MTLAQLGPLGSLPWLRRGTLTPSQHQWTAACQQNPPCLRHLPLRRAAWAPCTLPSASHAGFLLVLLLLAVWILAANSFAGGPPPEACEHRQEWVAGARVGGRGGCPSSLPSASCSFWAVVVASPGDPDGHTSSVCWSPPTHHSSTKQAHCRLPASHACGSGRGNRLLAPSGLPSSRPSPLLGTSLCLFIGERTFLSEMPSNQRGN